MNHQKNEALHKTVFRQGFFTALCTKRARIAFENPAKMHRTFGALFAEAAKTMPSPNFEFLSSISIDPIFSRYAEVTDLLVEAEADTIIHTCPGMIYLDMDKDEAEAELERNPHAGWFSHLADFFLRKAEEPEPVLV